MDIFAKVSLIDDSDDTFSFLFKLEKEIDRFIWVNRVEFITAPITYKIIRSSKEIHNFRTFFTTYFKDGDFDVISV